jgi:hypothetical protein
VSAAFLSAGFRLEINSVGDVIDCILQIENSNVRIGKGVRKKK